MFAWISILRVKPFYQTVFIGLPQKRFTVLVCGHVVLSVALHWTVNIVVIVCCLSAVLMTFAWCVVWMLVYKVGSKSFCHCWYVVVSLRELFLLAHPAPILLCVFLCHQAPPRTLVEGHFINVQFGWSFGVHGGFIVLTVTGWFY